MTLTIALAGDTMLGRGVAELLKRSAEPAALFSTGVREALSEADLVVLNLECCISDRGARWPDPFKRYFFRAPPAAAGVLARLGVDCVTLANNHALDFGVEALADTRSLLARAGVRVVGVGTEAATAREFAVLETAATRVAVVGVTDHPAAFAASDRRPGVAWADLRAGVPDWPEDTVARAAAEADVVLVTPHWGPNMTTRPPPHVQQAAARFLAAGATLVAGHSAHVFHGVADRVIYDMGGFVDDYAADPELRNDLGLLFLVTVGDPGPADPAPVRVRAVPLFLDYCHTRLARGAERTWIRNRFTVACAELGTAVHEEDGCLTVDRG
ncbi:CapA family protein [Kitasatospora sp. NPDC093679]|uniref:CapA family protein n=1 Tax=Kitasatospora sp. NPDC093679 TaxID=3154983 RepID=UPI00344AFE42